MKNQFALPALGLLLLAGTISAVAQQKTANPVAIDPEVIGKEPYRFNGAVLSEVGRGSGFCAWNRHTFFSAAHVVYEPGGTAGSTGGWQEPPIWYPTINAATTVGAKAIPSRGYYRWTAYGDFADTTGSTSDKTFSQDAILAYAFKGLIPGRPASLNLNGVNDLQKKRPALITGYPARNFYFEQDIAGYFLHETGPVSIPYQRTQDNYLTTSLIATGGGNSGGPIWTKRKSNSKWQAAGILISGRPSGTGVYAFSSETRSLLKAVEPVVKRFIGEPVSSDEISASSYFFPFHKNTVLPDGTGESISFPFDVNTFGEYDTVKDVKISLKIKTKHRGDLEMYLQAPDGSSILFYNQNGAGGDNLVINDLSPGSDGTGTPSSAFVGTLARGQWKLIALDTLKGDRATVQKIVLEVSAIAVEPPPPAPEPPVTTP